MLNVALVQAAPAYLDLEATLERLRHWLEQAKAADAQLVVLGETWLTGYPAWVDSAPDAALWGHPPTKRLYAALRASSVTVPGPHTERIGQWCAELGLTLVIGVNERVDTGPGNRTLYNSLLTFDADGRLVNHHRKLVPTFTERLVWGPGDTRGLRVPDTAAGRVGGLICWEHWMPLPRQALHTEGEQVHVAVWPTVHDIHQVASRHYAFEGRCFVLASGLLMRVGDLPADLRPDRPEDTLLCRGGSCVIGPDGGFVVEPVFDTECLVLAQLDLTRIDEEAMTLDVTGHYARPELFDFRVRGRGEER